MFFSPLQGSRVPITNFFDCPQGADLPQKNLKSSPPALCTSCCKCFLSIQVAFWRSFLSALTLRLTRRESVYSPSYRCIFFSTPKFLRNFALPPLCSDRGTRARMAALEGQSTPRSLCCQLLATKAARNSEFGVRSQSFEATRSFTRFSS